MAAVKGKSGNRLFIFKVDPYAIGNDRVERETADFLRNKRSTGAVGSRSSAPGKGCDLWAFCPDHQESKWAQNGRRGDVLVSLGKSFADSFYL